MTLQTLSFRIIRTAKRKSVLALLTYLQIAQELVVPTEVRVATATGRVEGPAFRCPPRFSTSINSSEIEEANRPVALFHPPHPEKTVIPKCRRVCRYEQGTDRSRRLYKAAASRVRYGNPDDVSNFPRAYGPDISVGAVSLRPVRESFPAIWPCPSRASRPASHRA